MKKAFRQILFLLFLAILFSQKLGAQQLILSEIMKGDDFVGYSPQNLQWSADSKTILFEWNPNMQPGFSPFTYSFVTKKTEQVKANEIDNKTFNIPTSNLNQIYFSENGNLAVYDTKAKTKTIVIDFAQSIHSVEQTADGKVVFFQIESDVYEYNLAEKRLRQLTQFQVEKDVKLKESSKLEQQQTALFPYLEWKQKKQDFSPFSSVKEKSSKTIEFASSEYVKHTTVSKNGQFICFVLHQEPTEQDTKVAKFITENGYTALQNARPKVSDQDPVNRLGIFNRVLDSVIFISFDKLTDIRKKPNYLSEYGKDASPYSENRKLCIHAPISNPDGKTALVDIRSFDNKDRWIILLDLATGTYTELEQQHDEAWIGGPGISGWNESNGTLEWINTDSFIFQSEETGYSHLYSYSISSKAKKKLTSGKWEVYEAFLSKNKQTLYFIANKIHPGVRNGYTLSMETGKITPIFEGKFGIEWTLSPDEKTWALRYSTINTPWELCFASNQVNATIIPITQSQTENFKKLNLIAPKIIEIPTSDGKMVYGKIYKPGQSNGAAVLFVHGAGYLQNVTYSWSYYQREMLFHELLREKGYTIIDLDYRASEGYGRDWRTDIYRDMGNRDLADYIDAKNYLVKNEMIDSNRVGIYGGSYGGFITLMAMLKTSTTFACGAALRSVTDWMHYNHEYTSNILNYPSSDSIAYFRSSPINFADGLKNPLLMLHGMVDDNVQFQDIVRLNQRFIELGKTNYSLAVFPTEAHSFTYTPAWVDEYRRILELFESHLIK